jgi:hypothetical protein
MDLAAVLATAGGAALVLLILVDVFLTVLHIDRDGPVAGNLHHGMWRLAVAVSRAAPRIRRSLLGLIGPLMIVMTFFVWVAGYIVGFALIYWPFLDLFRSDDEAILTFADALYFSGMTGSTLGYGDITPATPLFQALSFIEATLGFGLLSGIVTYLLNIVSGVAERNALALWLHNETAGTADGVEAVIRSTRYEDVGDLRMRFVLLTHALQRVHQKILQFPILDLFYRSKDPGYGPEAMLKAAAEMAIAGQLLARAPRARRLRLAGDELGLAVGDVMRVLSRQHMGGRAWARIESAHPEAADLELAAQIRRRLEEALVMSLLPPDEQPPTQVLALTATTRKFLDELDRITAWRMDRG